MRKRKGDFPDADLPAAKYFLSQPERLFKQLTPIEQIAAVQGHLFRSQIIVDANAAMVFIPFLAASPDQERNVLLTMLNNQVAVMQAAAASAENKAATAGNSAVKGAAIDYTNSGALIVAPNAAVVKQAQNYTTPQLLRDGGAPTPDTPPQLAPENAGDALPQLAPENAGDATPVHPASPVVLADGEKAETGEKVPVAEKAETGEKVPVAEKADATTAPTAVAAKKRSVYGVLGAAVKAGCALIFGGMTFEWLTTISLGITSALSSFLKAQAIEHYAYAYDMRASSALTSASLWLIDPSKQMERMAISVVVIGATALAAKYCYSSQNNAQSTEVRVVGN